jgi:WD40 repeat protein
MRRKFVFILTLSVLLASLLCVGFDTVEVKASDGIDTSKVYDVEMLWNNSMSVNDVAVSKNGSYLVAVNNTGVYYFASDDSSPKWWYLSSGGTEYFLSVAMSADGEYLVAGNYNGYIHYFNDSIAATGQRLSPTWKSVDLGGPGGPVERGTLDMSDDGEYVVTGGTGIDIWYFAGCRGRSGSDEEHTWSNRIEDAEEVLAVDMSPDGAYVAAGGKYAYWTGTEWHYPGFVVFYKNANVAPYPTEWDWLSITHSINTEIGDLALSDDGYAVVAVDEATIGTLYYWANATALSGAPNATWTNYGAFDCVDMSADGDEVVAGTAPILPCGLHFWTGAKGLSGSDQDENWTRLTGENVLDVAMSDDGGVIAAATINVTTSDYKACFFKSDGRMIGEFNLTQYTPLVSMSDDGRIVAMGNPLAHLTLHVFELLEDSTPPLIEDVHQLPTNDTVTPDDKVMVYANVSDDQTGVKQVTLSYTTDNETYFNVNMTNLEGYVWNGSIPAFEYCTWVNYTIIAEDNVGNTITTGELFGYWYQYHVIPEFPSLLILPLFMIATLLAAIFRRRKRRDP